MRDLTRIRSNRFRKTVAAGLVSLVSKRPARNSLILTGVFLMFMCGVLMDSSAQETQPHLIASIFPQIGGLESKLYFALVGGADSRRTLPDGTRVPGIQKVEKMCPQTI